MLNANENIQNIQLNGRLLRKERIKSFIKNDKFLNCETLFYHNLYSIIKAKNYLETSQSFLLYSHVRNINLERDSIKAYARKCGYLRTGSKFVHSSRKYLLTLLIVMTGYVCTYHQNGTGIQKSVYANFRINLGGSKA